MNFKKLLLIIAALSAFGINNLCAMEEEYTEYEAEEGLTPAEKEELKRMMAEMEEEGPITPEEMMESEK